MPETLKNAKLKNRGELITMQKGNLYAWVWKDKKNVFYLSTNCDPTTANTTKTAKGWHFKRCYMPKCCYSI
jgi:hypothetical protein